MTIETPRLILRPWQDSDASALFRYARDPDVGPLAGWPPHHSIEESLSVIRNVFSVPGCFAVCLRETGEAVGCAALKLNGSTDMTDRDDECELGYWLGKPHWGQGLIPEAAAALMQHGFADLGMTKIWVGYYDGNLKSKRVQEKLGFRYQWTTPDVEVPLMGEVRVGYVSAITRDEWHALRT